MKELRGSVFVAIVIGAVVIHSESAAIQQSPVDVFGGVENIALPKVTFDYPNVNLTMKTYNKPASGAGPDDHPAKKYIEATTSKIVATDNIPTLTVSNLTYKLVNIHFHVRSEHEYDGEDYPMEMHMVHQRVTGGKKQAYLAVGRWVIVTENESMGGLNPKNPQLDQMLNNLPVTPAVGPNPNTLPINNFALSGLLPTDESSYRYNGSLTTFGTNAEAAAMVSNTPVRWVMYDEPLYMTLAQINKFVVHDAKTGARDVQNILGSDLMTDITGIPEPSTLGLLAVAGLVTGLRRRR